MDHSFMVSNFKIKSEKQLNELKKLGLKQILFNPEKSDCQPLPLPIVESSPPPPSAEALREKELLLQKKERVKKLKLRKASLNRCEKEYSKTVGAVRELMGKMKSQPGLAMREADEMITDLIDSLMTDQEASMHLVNIKGKSESSYFHSINVSILALMLAKKLGLNERQMHIIGLGALFHDIGHEKIPDKILRKTEPLEKAELDFYQMHPTYGVEIAKGIGTLPKESVMIIKQHHEMFDGSGFPDGLKGAEINELAQIVSLVNTYDNLCNKISADESLTPYEAIALMFAKEKQKYDPVKLTSFITQMGVYPPGTAVKLSDDRVGAVISINMDDLLSPNVMIYDPTVAKEEAWIINPKEEKLSISKSLRRNSLSDEILAYLDLGESVNFYIDIKPDQ